MIVQVDELEDVVFIDILLTKKQTDLIEDREIVDREITIYGQKINLSIRLKEKGEEDAID